MAPPPPPRIPPATSTTILWATSSRCSTASSWSVQCSWAARWARPRPWRSRSLTPSGCPPWCRSPPPTTARSRTASVDMETWERLADALESGGVDEFVRDCRAGRQPAGALARDRARGHAASAWSATSTRRRSQPRCAWCRARRPSRASSRSRPSRRPRSWWARATRRTRLHPLEVARAYAERLPNAEFVVEDEGQSPLSWQGARLSGLIGEFLERSGVPPQE